MGKNRDDYLDVGEYRVGTLRPGTVVAHCHTGKPIVIESISEDHGFYDVYWYKPGGKGTRGYIDSCPREATFMLLEER